MKATILDSISENEAQCYLCKINLKEYIENLPRDYRDYEVQREIVTNVYLDNLINTVLYKYHIPPIVLIANHIKIEKGILAFNDFKILDGLQRTYRLNSIWKTIKVVKNELKQGEDIFSLSPFAISKRYSSQLHEIESNSNIFITIIDFCKKHIKDKNFNIEDGFLNNYQWFEIWTNLTPEDEVNKMLILNAGHKPVKIKHQLELIFRGLLPIFSQNKKGKFQIVREKEISAIQFGKQRKLGQFHFSHLIASLLSIREGEAITTNSALIQKLQNTDFDNEKDRAYFKYTFIEKFIDVVVELDEILYGIYHDEGLKWFGREVSLVGIFGALGHYLIASAMTPEEGLQNLLDRFKIYAKYLNLKNYEDVRNAQDLAKINIGTVNKKAVFDAILEMLSKGFDKNILWKNFFK